MYLVWHTKSGLFTTWHPDECERPSPHTLFCATDGFYDTTWLMIVQGLYISSYHNLFLLPYAVVIWTLYQDCQDMYFFSHICLSWFRLHTICLTPDQTFMCVHKGNVHRRYRPIMYITPSFSQVIIFVFPVALAPQVFLASLSDNVIDCKLLLLIHCNQIICDKRAQLNSMDFQDFVIWCLCTRNHQKFGCVTVASCHTFNRSNHVLLGQYYSLKS